MLLNAPLRRLRPWTVSFLMGGSLLQGAQAQSDWHLHSHFQAGVDGWHIEHSAQDKTSRDNMYLADSETLWTYRPLSPWYTLQSQLDWGPQHQVVLRARANQVTGASVDQLYYSHAISPYLGFRAGVADYRSTWCREYDLDNPWIRESDPFCTNYRIKQPFASAPALQVYVNLDEGDYQVQGIAGIFRPRALGYAPREFGTAILPPHVNITQNHKQGLSLNVLNKASSTEWRLSWMGLDQRLFDPQAAISFPEYAAGTQMNYRQKAGTFFAGVSWQLSPRLRSRLTHMHNALKAHCELLTPQAAPACEIRVRKKSTVLELNYQPAAADTVSLAVLKFPFSQSQVYKKTNQTVSASWRRDWSRHWFTALQWSQSRATVFYNDDFSTMSYLPGTNSAWAAGIRSGYKW